MQGISRVNPTPEYYSLAMLATRTHRLTLTPGATAQAGLLPAHPSRCLRVARHSTILHETIRQINEDECQLDEKKLSNKK